MNPFTPSFGTVPAKPVGRDPILGQYQEMFRQFSPSDVRWASHLRAHRGAGKTVLLDQIQELAAEYGWWVLQEDGGAGDPLPARIINRSLTRLAEHSPKRRGRQIKNVSVLGTSIGLEAEQPNPQTVTSVRDALTSVIAAERNGVLVTIDEVHQTSDAALNEIGNAAQHIHRQQMPLVILMAGLPDEPGPREPTFLARAWRPDITALSDVDIERGLTETAAVGDRAFEPMALRLAVELSDGQPFMMQLIGYEAWERANGKTITVDDVSQAASKATDTFVRAVTEQIVARTSPNHRKFLRSVLHHGSPARMADIRSDHDWTSSYGGVVRARMIEQGLIRPAGHGRVEFAVPGIEAALDALEPPTEG